MEPVRITFEAAPSITAIANDAVWAVTLLSGSLIIVALLRLAASILERGGD